VEGAAPTGPDIPGARYDARRQWLLPQGVVARDLANHPLFPRPKKNASGKSYAVSFDELAGNTLLGMHISRLQPGAHNRGHRHVDEALILILAGRGWSELRQSDDADMQVVEWQAGDMLAIPANAWHQHFNASDQEPTRQLAFKDTRFLRNVFGSRSFVYDNDFRFTDRYNDEPDYWTSRSIGDDGVISTNAITSLDHEPLTPDSRCGSGVSTARYRLGGHRNLEARIVEIDPGGNVERHLHRYAEEAAFVLSGSGRTAMSSGDRTIEFEWSAGDLFCVPLGVDHQHQAVGLGPTRLLMVRNVALEHALHAAERGFDVEVDSRFPSLVEPDYSNVDLATLQPPD
jgi:quercetin dioxygenase-like cupin family protein